MWGRNRVSSVLAPQALARCPECGTELAPALLCCPGCQRLVHGPRLRELADSAEHAASAGDASAALAAWREALDLLPPGTRQHAAVSQKLLGLSREVDRALPRAAAAGPRAGSAWARLLLPLGTLGLLLWKFKFVLALVLSKGKLLLLGLTKAPTLFSMLLSLSVYWTAWGWKFALGLVASLYIYEMGHVASLRRFGIKATAPMFVPGLGAFVRLNQYPTDPREDARVGLAGPLWGLGAAAAAYAVALASGSPAWAAIARAGAWLNLFNLLPIWQLDGGRGFRALSRGQRGIVALTIAVAWVATHEGLLALLLLVAGTRALLGRGASQGDGTALAEFVLLVAALSALSSIRVVLPDAG